MRPQSTAHTSVVCSLPWGHLGSCCQSLWNQRGELAPHEGMVAGARWLPGHTEDEDRQQGPARIQQPRDATHLMVPGSAPDMGDTGSEQHCMLQY